MKIINVVAQIELNFINADKMLSKLILVLTRVGSLMEDCILMKEKCPWLAQQGQVWEPS